MRLTCLAHLLCLCWLPALTAYAADPAPADFSSIRGCFGTYDAAPRLADGRVDLTRLLRELRQLRADTYNWLVWHRASDWDDLQLFLPEASSAGIKVWVTLVPPSESPPRTKNYSEPFRTNYVRWATEIAQLGWQHTNLVAWSIDDFTHNLAVFTPASTTKMLAEARAINPRLLFLPCCYYRGITDQFAGQYRGILDGVLFPFRDESGGANLTNASSVATEIAAIRKKMGAKPVVVDVYATAHSRLGASTPDYVEQVMQAGRGSADGVLIYCHQDPERDPAKFEVLRRVFAGWRTAERQR